MRTLIENVRVFDGTELIPGADVLLDGDRITNVAPAASGLRADVRIDGSGRTLLPGLIDAHTHAFEGSLKQALTFGVTTELDMFSMRANAERLRRTAAESDDVADIRSAGVGATAPDGHPIQFMGELYGPFDTVAHPGQAAAFVEARLAEGSDYLKIVIDDGSSGGGHIPHLGPDTVAALVTAAHDAGLRAVAHVATARDATIALDAGVDGLAHVYTDAGPGSEAADELATRAADQGVFVIGAMALTEAITSDGGSELWRDERIWPHLPERARAAATAELTGFPVNPNGISNALHAAAALHRAGVPLLAGTDANDGPHGGFLAIHGASIHRELVLLTLAGLTPRQALAAATSMPAHHFGLADRGRIAPGLRADLLLVDGDPTQDITVTRSIVEVWRRGTRHARSHA